MSAAITGTPADSSRATVATRKILFMVDPDHGTLSLTIAVAARASWAEANNGMAICELARQFRRPLQGYNTDTEILSRLWTSAEFASPQFSTDGPIGIDSRPPRHGSSWRHFN